jgi:cation/acetate symporter
MNYTNPSFNFLGISHLSAGIFGMPANFLLVYVVSKVTTAPPQEIQDLVDELRHPQDDDALIEQMLDKRGAVPVPAGR